MIQSEPTGRVNLTGELTEGDSFYAEVCPTVMLFHGDSDTDERQWRHPSRRFRFSG